MTEVHYTNLLIVVAVGVLAPLALGFFPRVRLPAIVLEIVLGIVIGPSGLGWVQPDAPVSILALVGLAFLLFLSGLEIDVRQLHRRILKLTALGFAASFVVAIIVGIGLHAGGFVKSPLFVAIVLVATSLGVIVPVLKDSDNIDSSFGQLVITAASIADFGSIILLSLFFSGKSSTSTAGRLILLGIFGLVVLLVGIAIASVERSRSLSRVLRHLQDTTAEIRVRAAFLLLIGFTALADTVGLETILGAFAAGVLLSLIDQDQTTTHPQFRLKLDAVGFGVFTPIFFVTTGLRFDLNALFASTSTVARVPMFLLAIILSRSLPALVYVRLLGRSHALIAGILQATSLPFIVAATQIGLQLGVVSRASAAGLVAAGLLSVVISPALGLALLRHEPPKTAIPRAPPTPVMPGLTAEDLALRRPTDGHDRPSVRRATLSASAVTRDHHRRSP
jgi:Kef-type K+ transport system membrane component KefB